MKAKKTSDIGGARRRKPRVSKATAVKTFDALTAKEKDDILKVLAIGAGLIAPDKES